MSRGKADGWPAAGQLPGRQKESKAVLDALDSATHQQGRLLLVEGGPGTGKSALAAMARDWASQRGFTVVAVAARQPAGGVPLAPMLAALQLAGAAAGEDGQPGLGAEPARASTVLTQLQGLVSAAPVLVTIDDLHQADPATSQACRAIPRMLAPAPLSWIFTRNTDASSRSASLLFDLLAREGATRIELRPLDREAQLQVISDVLGADPDERLIELAADAGGNPALLTEYFRLLAEEKAVVIARGKASLTAGQVAYPAQSLAHRMLGRLSTRTRQLLETASVLGQSFRLEDAAAMLGESPGALLAAVEEAIAARLLTATPQALAFRHEFIRQAAAKALPPPVRQALHRQFGEMLLERGGPADPAVHHLLRGASAGDAAALAASDRAVAELLPADPHAAAELATEALELTRPADPARFARTLATVRALTAGGRWEQAGTLARSALAVPLPAASSAALHCALACELVLSGQAMEAVIEAQNMLAAADVPAGVRDDAAVVLLRAWLELRGNQQVSQFAAALAATPGAVRGEVAVAVLVARALVLWDRGRLAESLDLAAEAAQLAATGPAASLLFQPQPFLAARLIDTRRLTEATAMVSAAGFADGGGAAGWPAGTAELLRARIALAAGRLDDAAVEAEACVFPPLAGTPAPDEPAAALVLTLAVLRKGDLHTAGQYVGKLPGTGRHLGAAYETGWAQVAAAQVAEASQGDAAAMALLGGVFDELPEHRWVLVCDPATAPWLVRAALAAGLRQRAEQVVTAMGEISRGNPDFTAIRAAAEQAEGLLTANLDRLRLAAAQQPDPWARACAAEDAGVLAAETGQQPNAVQLLGEALRGFAALGAIRDAARIRRRLRLLGVRQRHWATSKRPATGWDSLTGTEGAVAELVAQGLQNQQIASQLYISTHTVAFHLRHVFRKLGIRSRVDLARLALEHDGDGRPE